MYDPDNIRNCDECPNNMGCDDFQHRLPCGQWHCWVAIHYESTLEGDDNDE